MNINEAGYYEVGLLTGYSLKWLIDSIQYQIDFAEGKSEYDLDELKYTLDQLKEAEQV